MAKRRFLGPKSVEKVVFGPEIILTKSVKKWPKKGQKLFSGPKRVENVVFCPKIFLSQISHKMAKIWPHTRGAASRFTTYNLTDNNLSFKYIAYTIFLSFLFLTCIMSNVHILILIL